MTDAQPSPKFLSQEVNLRSTLFVLEIAIAALLLILFSEGFVTRLIAPEQEVEGSTILRLMWLPAYGFIALLALKNAKRFGLVIINTPFLIALIIMASVSCLWSIDPALSFRRGIAISFTTLFGLYLAARFNWRELLLLFGGVWFFLAITSLVAGVLFPDFARMSEVHVGAWRGMWWEKNAMGGHMARASFIMMFLAVVDKRRRPLWVIGIILTAALVLLSTSKTALVGTLVGALVILVGAWMRRGPVTALSIGWAGVSFTGSVFLALIIAPEVVFGLLGRDATLTGRTDIWSALVTAIAERPWLGYGYGAFCDRCHSTLHWMGRGQFCRLRFSCLDYCARSRVWTFRARCNTNWAHRYMECTRDSDRRAPMAWIWLWCILARRFRTGVLDTEDCRLARTNGAQWVAGYLA